MAVITLHVTVDDFRQLWFFKHTLHFNGGQISDEKVNAF
jgi:hypothetical protein